MANTVAARRNNFAFDDNLWSNTFGTLKDADKKEAEANEALAANQGCHSKGGKKVSLFAQ